MTVNEIVSYVQGLIDAENAFTTPTTDYNTGFVVACYTILDKLETASDATSDDNRIDSCINMIGPCGACTHHSRCNVFEQKKTNADIERSLLSITDYASGTE